MSSLLDGIDIKDPSTEKPRSSGPKPAVIKGTVAGALFLMAGVFIGMQTGLIPVPFGSGQSARAVPYTPQDEAAKQATLEILREREAEFIAQGGQISGS